MVLGRLPDFVIAGVPKAGTTSVARWLQAHPDGWLAPEKELRFFNMRRDEGLDWYRSQFAGAPDGAVAGEATPGYLQDGEAVACMTAALPDSRFVVLLREPVDRAWSNYWFFRQLGGEHRTWSKIMAAEAVDPLRGPKGMRWGYLWAGQYGPMLQRLFDLAGRDRVQVHLFDDLRVDATSVLAAICAHVGLDPGRLPPTARTYNPTLVPRSARVQQLLHVGRGQRWPLRLGYKVAKLNLKQQPYPHLPANEMDALREGFVESNMLVEDLLARKLPAHWWPAGR